MIIDEHGIRYHHVHRSFLENDIRGNHAVWVLFPTCSDKISEYETNLWFHGLYSHSQVEQWIRLIKSDISEFINKNDQNPKHLSQWLIAKKPFLYKNTFIKKRKDHCNFDVRLREEVQWQRRKYAMWMRSSFFHFHHRSKLNVFYNVPEDVSRYIIHEFI